MKTTITRHGYRLKGGKLEEVGLSYDETSSEKVAGYGTPITKNVAKQFIKNYWDELELLRDELKDNKVDSIFVDELIDDQNVAFTVGKEALMYILAQENCAGIRFYLAKKSAENKPEEDDNYNEGTTLVAVGVSEDSTGKANDLIHGKYITENIMNIQDDSQATNSYSKQTEVETPISEFCGVTKYGELKPNSNP